MALIKRGQIYHVKRFPSVGSEIYGDRPAVIVSNDKNNRFSSVVEIVYFSSSPKTDLPTHVLCRSFNSSYALCEQITSVDVSRLSSYLGTLSASDLALIDSLLLVSLGIGSDVVSKPSSSDEISYKHLYESLLDKLVSLNK